MSVIEIGKKLYSFSSKMLDKKWKGSLIRFILMDVSPSQAQEVEKK